MTSKRSSERTPTKIVVGYADEQTSSKGFQAAKPIAWGGVQERVLTYMAEETKENQPVGYSNKGR